MFNWGRADRMMLLADLIRQWGCGVYCWKGVDPGGARRDPASSSHHNKTFSIKTTENFVRSKGHRVKNNPQIGQRMGRAYDVYIGQPASNVPHVNASAASRAKLALHIRHNFTPYLAEGIFNSGVKGKNLSVKNGKAVSKDYWGTTTWDDHKDHIHIAF